MKTFTTLLLALVFFTSQLNAQNNFWAEIDKTELSHLDNSKSGILETDQYQTFELDVDGLYAHLSSAPLRHTEAGKNSSTLVDLPYPDGSLHTFKVVESPCMMPGLAAKFPSFKTYFGYDSKTKTVVRFGFTENGFHASFSGPGNNIYIDPFGQDQSDFYSIYNTEDYKANVDHSFTCLYEHEEGDDLSNNQFNFADSKNDGGTDVEMVTYRLAIATTGTFSQAVGGTTSSVMAEIVIMVNRLNLMMGQDLAVHLNLVDNNDEILFLTSAEDPYFNTDLGGALLNQNTTVLNNVIGASNYDFGHILTENACSDGLLGVASGANVCGSDKGGGVTCVYSSNIDVVAIETTSHEMGHQLNMDHTWSNCYGDPGGQFVAGTAMEPGAGTTSLSYGTVCTGSQTIQNFKDPYYHVMSLLQGYVYTRDGGASLCGEHVETDNTTPIIEFPFPNDFYIPINTPFELTAEITDEQGDEFLVNWDQFDTGPYSWLGNPMGTAPSFRSMPPNEFTNRVCPRMSRIISGNMQNDEVMPTYSREFNFMCVARDLNMEAAGVSWEQFMFNATDMAGPFRVSHGEGVEVQVGDYYELTWDVANTDAAPVNCAYVDILMSVDGGFTYPYTLSQGVPNDGVQNVVIPNQETTTARFRVNGAQNIFFNISESNVTILPPTEPGFAVDAGPYFQQICLPDLAVIDISTVSILGYEDPISFEIVDGLPPEAIINYINNPVTPSETGTIEIDLLPVGSDNQFEITIETISNLDTNYRTVLIDIVSNDYSEMVQLTPENGVSAQLGLPELSWAGVTDADYYEVEIATDPAFENIVASAYNYTETSFTPETVLDVNSLFYWRVRGGNTCGDSGYTETWAFHTESFACENYESTNVPLNIPVTGTATIESFLTISQPGTINDLNVSKVKINHDWIQHIDASLISPVGTEVKLFTGVCFNTNDMNLGFDDEAADEVPCPPVSSTVHLPEESLSAFDNEDALGTWLLKVQVNNTLGNGGSVIDWNLDICSSFTPNGPYLINNITMPVAPEQSRLVSQEFLEVQDDDTPPENLQYTVVDLPENGTLYYLGNPMEVGTQFNQQFLNDGGVLYQHEDAATTTDYFRFTVVDGDGGWYGIDQFNIVIDPSVVVGNEDMLTADDINVYPNPAGEYVFIDFSNHITRDMNVSIYNIQGQLLGVKNQVHSTNRIQMDTRQFASGLYILRIESGDQMISKKLTIAR